MNLNVNLNDRKGNMNVNVNLLHCNYVGDTCPGRTEKTK